MSNEKKPIPTKIILHKKSRTLEIQFKEGEQFIIPCAFLRAYSPSADMREVKRSMTSYTEVNILAIEPVGQYAIKPIFSDGHRTGIFSWETLYQLGIQYGARNS